MKRAALILFAALAWLAMPGRAQTLTTVEDTIYSATGADCAGTLTLTWQSFIAPDGRQIAPGTWSFPVLGQTNGLDIMIEPGPYTARYSLGPGCAIAQEQWIVPSSLVPVNLNAVRSNPTWVSRFTATTGDVALTSSGTTLTIQQPVLSSKLVTLETAIVYCSVACSVTQRQNGTPTSPAAGTPIPLLPLTTLPAAGILTASSISGGTMPGGILRILGGVGTDRNLTLTGISLPSGAGSVSDYSIIVSAITGTANITLIWNER